MNNFFPAFADHPRPSDACLLDTSVGAVGDRLRSLLATTTPADLSADHVRAEVEGNLWMLAPETFQYFLPAFMSLAVERYDSFVNFVPELVSALTEPTRDDVLQALDRLALIPGGIGLTPDVLFHLRQQQLEWYDSGKPLTTYRDRVVGLSAVERNAILDFLAAIRDTHGSDFPFNEPQIAIDRLRARGSRASNNPSSPPNSNDSSAGGIAADPGATTTA